MAALNVLCNVGCHTSHIIRKRLEFSDYGPVNMNMSRILKYIYIQ